VIPEHVLGDDTGTGVGLYVVCFTSSRRATSRGRCDVVLPAPSAESNQNGHLVNRHVRAGWNPLLDPAGTRCRELRSIVRTSATALLQRHAVQRQTGPGLESARLLREDDRCLVGDVGAEWQLSGGCTNAAQTDVQRISDSGLPIRASRSTATRCSAAIHYNGRRRVRRGAANSNAPDATVAPAAPSSAVRRHHRSGFGGYESADCGAGMAARATAWSGPTSAPSRTVIQARPCSRRSTTASRADA
jgi:hypothetical protein